MPPAKTYGPAPSSEIVESELLPAYSIVFRKEVVHP